MRVPVEAAGPVDKGDAFIPPVEPGEVYTVAVWHDRRVGWRSIVARVPVDVLREYATREYEPDQLDIVAGRVVMDLERLAEEL